MVPLFIKNVPVGLWKIEHVLGNNPRRNPAFSRFAWMTFSEEGRRVENGSRGSRKVNCYSYTVESRFCNTKEKRIYNGNKFIETTTASAKREKGLKWDWESAERKILVRDLTEAGAFRNWSKIRVTFASDTSNISHITYSFENSILVPILLHLFCVVLFRFHFFNTFFFNLRALKDYESYQKRKKRLAFCRIKAITFIIIYSS